MTDWIGVDMPNYTRAPQAETRQEKRIADYIAKVVAEAPPLSADQRAKIAALLAD